MATNNPRPSKAERTASAREKAAQMRATQEAAAKRKSLFVKLGVLGAVILVIALVVTLIVQNNDTKVADAGAVPAGGNAAGGILVTSPTTVADKTVDNVDITQLQAPAEAPTEPKPRDLTVGKKGEPVNITMYVDANCVHCADFEATYGKQINDWLAAGDVTVEYRNVGYLDGGSATNFSSRGANALACVANDTPSAYMPFVTALWGHYEQGEMKNAQLAEMAKAAGASDKVSSCIDKGDFRPYVQYTTQAAKNDGIAGTPTVIVQGKVVDLATQDFPTTVNDAIKANK
ncbi:thioredoxin domain-containing protein [Glutamicibacter sp.]|uniref:DsbA family protein n=1 Tax=Glutamicibacter sp. TaxID=1931995 RepID=UPI0028BF2F42|nr:thioredoxin domain-containing protein [Glutamicibacter sp.]